ncbi:MAG TPA: peroxidase-related enzyme [Longimicrobiaceae bacterium]|nr:peroxidase-related enzyme [Longimicrobiaceae bacterium]
MAHVAVVEGRPGIVGLLEGYPETGSLLNGLAQALLRTADGLSPGERELIATYVSSLNRCVFCTSSHAAAARHLLGEGETVDALVSGAAEPPVSPRLRALLEIAARVQQGGRAVGDDDVRAARAQGATDREIHDTVLIAAAFCMYNRYVDGLATWAPEDPAAYDEIGAHLAANGYRG